MAAFNLIDAVCWGITMIERLVADKPEMMSKIASTMSSWPIEAAVDDNWSVIVERLKKLKLGQDESVHRVSPQFYPAQGDDAQLPARWWAKQAVRCLTHTKDTQKRLSKFPAERLLRKRCRIAPVPVPAWAMKARTLPDFSSDPKVLSQWASLIREMIREQVPDFHNREEWARYRANSRTHSKKLGASPTKGAIQNAIIDDIVAALKTIAPRQPGKQQP